MSVMSSMFAQLMLKRNFLKNTGHQQFINLRYYSRKRNQIGTYGPFKIVKADHLCDDSGNLNHVNNINWELFATSGYPFFMPGNVGPAWQNTETSESFVQIIASTLAASNSLFKIHSSTDKNNSQQKKTSTNNKNELKKNKEIHQCDILDKDTNNNNNKSNNNKLSCIVNECPMVLRKGVVELFGNTNGGRLIDLKSSILTVITLIQYPKNIYHINTNDSEYNIEHDDDIIEKLAKNFVLSAQDICMTLTVMGYWADFINPFSGKPYFSSTLASLSSSASSMYNTDQRFRCLDFQIVKQNNCTIIKNDKQHEYSFINNNNNSIVDNNTNSTTIQQQQQQQCDDVITVNVDVSQVCDKSSTTSGNNDTFIGNLFTNAPHNIGYLLDIKTHFDLNKK